MEGKERINTRAGVTDWRAKIHGLNVLSLPRQGLARLRYHFEYIRNSRIDSTPMKSPRKRRERVECNGGILPIRFRVEEGEEVGRVDDDADGASRLVVAN